MNESDDAEFAELTDGLRASFADDRFALRPTSAATNTIVAAARRRRRRREIGYATGGSVVVAAVLLGGFLLAGYQPADETSLADEPGTSMPRTAQARAGAEARDGASDEARAETDGPSVMAEPMTTGGGEPPGAERQLAPPPGEPAPMRVVGPDGYRALRLGMSYGEIRETGMLAGPHAPPRGCTRYRLAEGDDAVLDILVSARAGLAVVTANRAHTPEGVAVGSTREQVERTYPASRADDERGYRIGTGSGGYYRVTIGGDERVSSLLLVSRQQDCGRF